MDGGSDSGITVRASDVFVVTCSNMRLRNRRVAVRVSFSTHHRSAQCPPCLYILRPRAVNINFLILRVALIPLADQTALLRALIDENPSLVNAVDVVIERICVSHGHVIETVIRMSGHLCTGRLLQVQLTSRDISSIRKQKWTKLMEVGGHHYT